MTMKIEVKNNTAIGLLEFCPNAEIPEDVLFYVQCKLYNIQIDIWYDIAQNIALAKMRGSIVSMMQFRKLILIKWPNALRHED